MQLVEIRARTSACDRCVLCDRNFRNGDRHWASSPAQDFEPVFGESQHLLTVSILESMNARKSHLGVTSAVRRSMPAAYLAGRRNTPSSGTPCASVPSLARVTAEAISPTAGCVTRPAGATAPEHYQLSTSEIIKEEVDDALCLRTGVVTSVTRSQSVGLPPGWMQQDDDRRVAMMKSRQGTPRTRRNRRR